MDPTYFHAKRVNASFLKLVEIAKDEKIEPIDREIAREMIRRWERTHTFCFKNDDDALRVTWAKVYDSKVSVFTGKGFETIKPDVFSKKEGKRISLAKMERFRDNPPRTVIAVGAVSDQGLKRELFTHLPSCVANTLPWHVERAMRYFKINHNKRVIVEATAPIESDFVDDPRKRAALVSYIDDLIRLV